MTEKLAIVRTNIADLERTSAGGGETVIGLEGGDNLGNSEPSELWRPARIHPAVTYGAIRVVSGSRLPVDCAGLVNHNLKRGSGQIRYVFIGGDVPVGDSIPLGGRVTVLPDSMVDDVNVAGLVTYVDENLFAYPTYGPDGALIEPIAPGSPWEARFTFGAPTGGAPRVGAGLQTFVAYVHLDGGIPTYLTWCPQIRAELWEGGAFVRDLGTKYVTKSTGQMLLWPWNAADLATADGSAAEVKLFGIPFGASIHVDLDAINWYAETPDFLPASPVSILYDSGWLDAVTDLGVAEFGHVDPAEEDPTATHSIVLEQEYSVTGVWVFLRDDQTPVDLDINAGDVIEPEGYVQAGVIFAGKAWRPTYNFPNGGVELLGLLDLSEVVYADGGQSWGQARGRLRTISLPLEFMLQSEAHALYDMLWRKGRLSPFPIILLPGSASEAKHTTLWVRCESTSLMRTHDAIVNGLSLRGMSLNLVEYL